MSSAVDLSVNLAVVQGMTVEDGGEKSCPS